MRSFASDNNSGVHPLIMDAILKANEGHALGYGTDKWTEEAISAIKKTFTEASLPLFVFNGTGSNVVAMQLLTRSYNSIICAETAHIYVDECGAPVKMTGAQIRPVLTADGKLTPELIHPYLVGFGDQHHSQPSAIYISQCTELGTIYTVDEIKAITELAHQYNMYVHMDGARIANACAALGVSLHEMTIGCDIDTLSFGGTKNGLMMGECVVVFNDELKSAATFVRKQSSQLASKMRYISSQFTAYLTDDLWLTNASHANDMASYLYNQLKRYDTIHFTQAVQSNQLFMTMPRGVIDEMLNDYYFYFWNESMNEIRLVTSFDTTKEDIDQFIARLDKAFAK